MSDRRPDDQVYEGSGQTSEFDADLDRIFTIPESRYSDQNTSDLPQSFRDLSIALRGIDAEKPQNKFTFSPSLEMAVEDIVTGYFPVQENIRLVTTLSHVMDEALTYALGKEHINDFEKEIIGSCVHACSRLVSSDRVSDVQKENILIDLIPGSLRIAGEYYKSHDDFLRTDPYVFLQRERQLCRLAGTLIKRTHDSENPILAEALLFASNVLKSEGNTHFVQYLLKNPYLRKKEAETIHIKLQEKFFNVIQIGYYVSDIMQSIDMTDVTLKERYKSYLTALVCDSRNSIETKLHLLDVISTPKDCVVIADDIAGYLGEHPTGLADTLTAVIIKMKEFSDNGFLTGDAQVEYKRLIVSIDTILKQYGSLPGATRDFKHVVNALRLYHGDEDSAITFRRVMKFIDRENASERDAFSTLLR